MGKYIFKISISLLMVVSFISLCKGQDNKAVIYQTFVGEERANDGGPGEIVIFDALSLQEMNRFKLTDSNNNPNPARIEITPDKKKAVIGNTPFGDSKGMLIVDLATGRTTKLFGDMAIYEIELASDGRVWALLDETKELAVINVDTLSVEKFILDEPGRDIVFSPDGNKAYISLFTKDIAIFEVKPSIRLAGGITQLPIRNKTQVRRQEMAISLDGSKLYISGQDTISIVDTVTKLVIDTINLPIGSTSLLLKLTPDGKEVYAAQYLGTSFAMINLSSKAVKVFRAPGTTGILSAVNISPNGSLAYISGFYGVSVFDVKKQVFIKNLLTSTGIGFPNPFSLGLTLTGDFSVGQAPSLTTVSPTSGDNILANQSVQITWTTTVAPQSYSLASHKIELSIDNGQTFTVIPGAEELPGDARSFTWTAPNIESLTAKIRVSTVDLGARRTSSTTGTFGILRNLPGDIDAPRVTFSSPVGGETFTSGSNLTINWTSSDNVGVTGQDLSLSLDGGQTFPITIASGLAASTQSFNFAIPQDLTTNQARLRLVVRDAAGNVGQAVTANNFTIAQAVDNIAPTVTISQPTTNTNLVAGSPIQVNWQSTDNRAVVSQALLLSLNGGQSFTQVASFGANDSSFVINNIGGLNLDFTTPQAIVRITATDQAGNTGMNNSTFIISPMLSMSSYQAKLLTVNGIGFMSNGNNNNVQIFINGKVVNVAPKTLTNTTITLKGNKKKLNLTKGGNTVRVIVDGVMSNESSFQF